MAGHDESCSCSLHDSGASQTLQELEFERGLWQAAKDGNMERVKVLLAEGSAVNATDSAGYTALHYACRSGHTSVCQLLLSSGADVNSQTPGGATGLHRAAYCGHDGVVRLLVGGGAEGGRVDSDGRTPLHKACEGGKVGVAGLLAREFPEVTGMRDKRGNFPRDLVPNWTQEWQVVLDGHNTN